MPIYEYRCEACGHALEQIQKISDPPLVDCPACGQPTLRKQISAAAFRLKGGGWYETDFKKSNQKNLHDSGKKKETKSGDSAASGSKSGSGSGDKGSSATAKPDASAAPKPKPVEKKPAA
ncbi:FmdB family zinc ribbon protein [Thiocapsa marina]|uniref:Regulatory protein, FmdB family n=1 Tax=Thiocapsa marina 5811 TaxID=768671 RepID=F9U7T9_9GAMM|nr:zinc ribbon domain-containing protein [Thiocapsa marina]EGV19719.1 regulatory protein, FmdB family [Thiocapsa marina 5811]